MDTLLHVGISNALAATVLALAATAAARLCRRPAVRHALWLLVLVKLVTPPLVRVPVPLVRHLEAAAAADGKCVDRPVVELFDDAPVPVSSPPSERSKVPAEVVIEADAELPAEVSAPTWSWQGITLVVWLGGAVGWWSLAAVRLRRFGRLLRCARLGPAECQEQAARLAARLGLGRWPRVWFVPAAVSPMLWAPLGRARLLVPESLWARLTGQQRDTLLAHELAHVRRRDPWVRRFELLVLGLYWWHPVVWWARRELRVAEEECCDAWVVWALPGAGPGYAQALVETAAYLALARTPLPLLASGAGHVHLLKRRLTMILHESTPRALSTVGLLALLCLAAVLLPLLPSFGGPVDEPAAEPVPVVQAATAVPPAVSLPSTQAAPTPEPQATAQPTPAVTRWPAVLPTTPAPGGERFPKTAWADPGAVEQARDEVELLEAQLLVKQAQLAAFRNQISLAHERVQFEKERRESTGILEPFIKAQHEESGLRAELTVKEAELREAQVRVQQARRRLSRLEEAPRVPNYVPPPTPTAGRPQPQPSAQVTPTAADPARSSRSSEQARLDELDRKVQALLHTINELRTEMKSRKE